MKKIIKNILLVAVSSCIFIACKKDEIKTVMQDGVPPVLSAAPATVVLTAANANDTVEVFSWTPSDYGYKAAVSYTVQIAKAGTNFAGPKEISMGSNTKLKYTGADLNQLALLRGLAPGSAGQLDVRIKSSLSDSLSIYSAKVTITVTPYLVIINYPSLWVAGDFNSWTPASNKISSKLGNGVYEGYINFPAGTPSSFKYTSDPDWNHTIYGWASSTVTGNDVSGTFNTTGGNLFTPTTGYYLLKGNTTSNTWSATKINTWGMIGDFNGWSADVAMTYNTTTKLWTGTINPAAAGVFKFRANNDWAINFGDTGADLSLEYNGSDIRVTPGSHLITLDISVPGNYTYKIQ